MARFAMKDRVSHSARPLITSTIFFLMLKLLLTSENNFNSSFSAPPKLRSRGNDENTKFSQTFNLILQQFALSLTNNEVGVVFAVTVEFRAHAIKRIICTKNPTVARHVYMANSVSNGRANLSHPPSYGASNAFHLKQECYFSLLFFLSAKTKEKYKRLRVRTHSSLAVATSGRAPTTIFSHSFAMKKTENCLQAKSGLDSQIYLSRKTARRTAQILQFTLSIYCSN